MNHLLDLLYDLDVIDESHVWHYKLDLCLMRSRERFYDYRNATRELTLSVQQYNEVTEKKIRAIAEGKKSDEPT